MLSHPCRRKLSGRPWHVQAIGEVPVGNEDLVKVLFVVGRALKMGRYSAHMGLRSALNGMEKAFLTCRREVPRNSGKVRTGNHRLAAHNGRSRGNPRRRMG